MWRPRRKTELEARDVAKAEVGRHRDEDEGLLGGHRSSPRTLWSWPEVGAEVGAKDEKEE